MQEGYIAFLKHVLRHPLAERQRAVFLLVELVSQDLGFWEVVKVYKYVKGSSSLGALHSIFGQLFMEQF